MSGPKGLPSSSWHAKTPLPGHASICVIKSMRWWEKTPQPNMIEIKSAQELVDTLSNSGERLVIVEFYSPGCGGCKALHPKIYQLAESNPNAIFLRVNHQELKPMCHALHIHVLPFFRFYKGSQGMQLDESEKRLEETQRKLARLRSRGNVVSSTKASVNGVKVKEERRSCSPLKTSEHSLPNHGDKGNGNSSKSYTPDHHRIPKLEQRPLLVIPPVNPKPSPPIKMPETSSKPSHVPTYSKSIVKEKGHRVPPEQESTETPSKGTKRKFDIQPHLMPA